MKITINLNNMTYQLGPQKAIDFLVNWHMENPCLSEDIDYIKDEKQRRAHYVKQLKDLDVETVKEIIKDYIENDFTTIEELKKAKVIQ